MIARFAGAALLVIGATFASPQAMAQGAEQSYEDRLLRLSEILGASFDKGLIDDARAELEMSSAEDFLLELTVLAAGRKAA